MGNGMIGRNRQDFTVNLRKIDFIVFFFWYNWLNIDDFQLFSNELGESKRRKMYEKGTWFGYGSRSAGGTLTGCGSSGGGSGKDGYSSAEKAAVAYWEAYYTLGTDKMMKLMPAEAKEHWEDELSLTSEQLTAYMEQELEKKSDIIKTFKSVSVDEQEELSIDRIQNFNENYLGEVGIKADEAVRCICTIYDDTGHIDDYRVTVYQYKGKWYSHSADAFFE